MTRSSGWDPIQDLMTVQKRMNQLFENALARTEFDADDGPDSWTPVGDVYETNDTLVVSLEIPGVEQSDVDVKIDRDDLVVEGTRSMQREASGERFHRVERSYGKFSRRFRLPSSVDRGGIQAVLRDGLLSVTLPKRADAGPVQLKVSIDG